MQLIRHWILDFNQFPIRSKCGYQPTRSTLLQWRPPTVIIIIWSDLEPSDNWSFDTSHVPEFTHYSRRSIIFPMSLPTSSRATGFASTAMAFTTDLTLHSKGYITQPARFVVYIARHLIMSWPCSYEMISKGMKIPWKPNPCTLFIILLRWQTDKLLFRAPLPQIKAAYGDTGLRARGSQRLQLPCPDIDAFYSYSMIFLITIGPDLRHKRNIWRSCTDWVCNDNGIHKLTSGVQYI